MQFPVIRYLLQLLSMKDTCLVDLVNILARVRRLSSKNSEFADKYEALTIFLEQYLMFLALSKADLLQLSKNKCFMLMALMKSFLAHFKFPLYEYGKYLFSLSYLSQMPELQRQKKIEGSSSNPSLHEIDDSACQSRWVRLDDWHDLAHQELTSIRCKYLSQLLKAYERVCSLSSKNKESATKYEAVQIFLLEFCKFLRLSRADIVQLSKGECYVFLMLIKSQLCQQLLSPGCQSQIPMLQDEADRRNEYPSSTYESASSDCAHLFQAEWLVLAQQELECLRTMYSSQLDKIYEKVYGLWCESSESNNQYAPTKTAIERTLNFLLSSRAEISHLSAEDLNNKIKRVKPFMEDPRISRFQSSANSACLVQSERLTNLNDQTYEELQLVKKKYYAVLLTAYNILFQNWQGSKSSTKYQIMRGAFSTCFNFLEMRRSSITLRSRKKYDERVKYVELVVAWSKKELARADNSEIKQWRFGYREVQPSCEKD